MERDERLLEKVTLLVWAAAAAAAGIITKTVQSGIFWKFVSYYPHVSHTIRTSGLLSSCLFFSILKFKPRSSTFRRLITK